MRGRLVVGSILVWSLCCVACIEARTYREADRARAIDQMERRLQSTAASKRAPLTPKTASSPAAAPASSPFKSAQTFLERIFGKPSLSETTLRPVSGKPASRVASKRPSELARSKDSSGQFSLQEPATSPGSSMADPAAAERSEVPARTGGSDLNRLVGSLLAHMAPMEGGSDDATLEAGSFRFEDYVYEQRKRGSGAAPGTEADAPRVPGSAAPDRLLQLLAQRENVRKVAAPGPEKKRDSSTALLGSVNEAPLVAESAPPPDAGKPGNGSMEGQSSTYKKALAKLQTYEAPTPPPLRAVSGFQGLMKAKPSPQAVEQDRAGVLSALQMK